MSEKPATRPAVVVIGGGYAGSIVARQLDHLADVTLVEPRDAFVHNVAALRARPTRPGCPRILPALRPAASNGRVVRDRAAKVEPGRVTLASGDELDADYIVLATGSTYPFPAKTDVDDTAAAHDKVRAATRRWRPPAGSCSSGRPGRHRSRPARSRRPGRAST